MNCNYSTAITKEYSGQLLKAVPNLIGKINISAWKRMLNIIFNKREEMRADERARLMNPFIDNLMGYMADADSEERVFCLGELEKVRTVEHQHRTKIDLEGFILSSVKNKAGTFTRGELSSLHDMLFEMYSDRHHSYTQAVETFEEITGAISKIPKVMRAKTIDCSRKILDKFCHEPANGNIESKNLLIRLYAKSLKEKFSVLGERIIEWTEKGLQVSKTPQQLRDYFENKERYFERELEKVMKGLHLSKVGARLLIYTRALTGRQIKIKESAEQGITCSFSEDAFFLPKSVGVFEDDEENFRVYKALASYQSGAFMFGTYQEPEAKNLINSVKKRIAGKFNLTDFLDSFSNPKIARALFEVLEFARIDSKLLQRFPGISPELKAFKNYLAEKLSPKKGIYSILRQAINPDSFKSSEHADICSGLRHQNSTVADTINTLDRIYKTLGKKADIQKLQAPENPTCLSLERIIRSGTSANSPRPLIAVPSSDIEFGRRYRYDEWGDGSCKKGFAQVIESQYPDVEDNSYVSEVISKNQKTIALLKKTFESLAPEEFERLTRQLSGEVNYSALVEARAEIAAGITPSEKLYYRDYKNTRSVASMVLSEGSGSLGRFVDIQHPDLRVMDIIKRTGIYFCEALESIGDRHAQAAFSGETEKNVNFYLIKDFDQPYNAQVKATLGSIKPLKQNRDGAGIRHASFLLSSQPEKLKILFYLADGIPHDFGYEGDYAIEDTKKAILESKQQGCLPVVLAFGRNIPPRFRTISEHCIYREVDNPNILPELLPALYRKMTI